MTGGALGDTGCPLFSQKGALTHHPQAGGGIPPVGRARALCEAAASCGSRGLCRIFIRAAIIRATENDRKGHAHLSAAFENLRPFLCGISHLPPQNIGMCRFIS